MCTKFLQTIRLPKLQAPLQWNSRRIWRKEKRFAHERGTCSKFTNLLSISKTTDSGFEVIFRKKGAEVVTQDVIVVLRVDRTGDLYCKRKPKDSVSAMTVHSPCNQHWPQEKRIGSHDREIRVVI